MMPPTCNREPDATLPEWQLAVGSWQLNLTRSQPALAFQLSTVAPVPVIFRDFMVVILVVFMFEAI